MLRGGIVGEQEEHRRGIEVIPHTHSRKRVLGDADIAALVEAFQVTTHENCRFEQINAEDLEAAVTFYKNFNKLMSESGSILWKTFLMAGVGGLLAILWLGFVSKIKQ